MEEEQEMEVRTLKAPKLATKVNLGPRVHCYRPCRQGPPRMEIERIRRGEGGEGGGEEEVQIVAHNYGHGGGGWTLAPGAVKYVNQLLLEAVRTDVSSDPGQVEIQVVGAGVLGLFTAYDLVKRGHRNVSVLAEHFEELTSHNAGGLLAPFAVETKDPKWKVLMDQISVDAYDFYAAIARGKNADFASEGAKFLPAYFDVGASGNMERYVRAGVMKPSKRVLVQFDHDDDGQRPSKQQQRKQRQMDVYDDGIFIEPHTMMGCLRTFLHSHGVPFVEQRVHSFAELKAPVIVNCTGMGAKQLCQDKQMFSVQGHLFLLKEQIPGNLDYMLVHWVSKGGRTESGQAVDRAVYLFPKRSSSTDPRSVGVLGGTFVAICFDADADTPNNEEFELVLRNAREFFDVQ